MVKMKNSGIEWIGEIPEDWEISKVKYELLNLDEKRKPISAEKRNQNADILYDYYGASGVIDKIDGYTIDDHVMLIGEDGANLVLRNLPLMYEVNGKAWINNHAHILKPQNKNVFKYLFFTLESTDLFPYITGSAQPKLNQENLNNIFIPIPNIKKQKRIADFLDVKCSKINSLNRDIEKQIEILEQYKKSVITEAVTKGVNPDVKKKDSGIEWIGEIPKHWETKRAKYIFTPRNDRGNKIELQLLSPTQKYGVIPQALYDEISGMNSVKLKENTDFNLLKTCHKGDYCISLRSFQGGFEYSKYEGVVSPAYQIFYPTIKIADGYYKYLFKEKNFIEKINSFTLSLRDGKPISYFDFSNMYLPLPSAEEQKKIADYLDSKCSSIDNIINSKKQQLEKLEEYKKSLIFEYVTGKREV